MIFAESAAKSKIQSPKLCASQRRNNAGESPSLCWRQIYDSLGDIDLECGAGVWRVRHVQLLQRGDGLRVVLGSRAAHEGKARQAHRDVHEGRAIEVEVPADPARP